MRRIILLMMAMLALPVMAAAAQTKPPELAGTIHAVAPVGSTQLRKLFMHVYDASFWSDTGGWQRPAYALSITYAMNFSAAELADRTRDEMARNGSLNETQRTHYRDQLATLWPDVKEGDRITALAVPGGATVFYANGKRLGSIADAAFTQAFFGIWLSESSSEPGMRNALLHLNP